MNCRETQSLLVAWQDGELSPGSSARISEHVAACPSCREIEMRLRAATPMAGPGLPNDLRRLAWDRIDRALELARAAPTPVPPSPLERLGGHLGAAGERVPMPLGAVVGYAMVLVLTLIWGTSNWWTASQLRAEVEGRRIVVEAPSSDVPAAQFRPASYAPAGGEIAPPQP